jgi:hypothetical protein
LHQTHRAFVSTGVIFAALLRVQPGDTVYVTEAPDGVRLTATNHTFGAQMELAEQSMREDRDILGTLAK